MKIQHSLSYVFWNFRSNWLIFLSVMQENECKALCFPERWCMSGSYTLQETDLVQPSTVPRPSHEVHPRHSIININTTHSVSHTCWIIAINQFTATVTEIGDKWKLTKGRTIQQKWCRVLSLSDCRYSLNPLSQTRIDWVGCYRIRWTFKLSCVWH